MLDGMVELMSSSRELKPIDWSISFASSSFGPTAEMILRCVRNLCDDDWCKAAWYKIYAYHDAARRYLPYRGHRLTKRMSNGPNVEPAIQILLSDQRQMRCSTLTVIVAPGRGTAIDGQWVRGWPCCYFVFQGARAAEPLDGPAVFRRKHEHKLTAVNPRIRTGTRERHQGETVSWATIEFAL